MAVDNDSGMAGSLTDLMTSLMVIFVLLLVVSLKNQYQHGQRIKEDLLRELQQSLSTLGGERVDVQNDPNDPLGLIVFVPQRLLNFQFGEATIPPGGVDFLEHFVPRMAAVVCSDGFQNDIDSVTIEGHTDPRGAFGFNVGLGQTRATNVAIAALASLGHDPHLGCFENFLTASGRGNTEVANGLSEAEMAGERRVEFHVRVRSAEERAVSNTIPRN